MSGFGRDFLDFEALRQGGTSSLARPSTSPEVERILASISASDDEGDWV